MLQAMVLSFGRLQFTQSYLQLHADSDILHNDLSFRGVMYKNDTIDIEIKYKEGHSSIQVALRGKQKASSFLEKFFSSSNRNFFV